MTCSRAEKLFSACWEDELSLVEREALEAHFTGCAACGRAYDGFVRTMESVQALSRAEVRPGFIDQVMVQARAAEREGARRSRPAAFRTWAEAWNWRPALAAAAMLVVVGAGALALWRSGVVNEPSMARRPTTTEPLATLHSPQAPETVAPKTNSAPTATQGFTHPNVASSRSRARAKDDSQPPVLAESKNEVGVAAAAAPSADESGIAGPVRGAAHKGMRIGRMAMGAAGETSPVPDSLFDHAYDVEFALDPVNLRRVPGTQSLSPARPMPTSQVGKRASITF